MTQLDDGLDPVAVAALIDDDDDEESKAITKEYLKDIKSTEDDEEEIDDDTTDATSDDAEDNEESDDTEEKNGKEDDEDPLDPPMKQSKDDDLGDDGGEEDLDKPSRKERRAQRQAEFMARLTDKPQKSVEDSLQFDHQPIDIKDGDYDPDELIADRNKLAASRYLQGVQAQKRVADEEQFWGSVESDAKLLVKEDRFKFLDPDDTENFDQKKSDAINNLYLRVIGYQEKVVTRNGQPVIKNGNTVKVGTAARKDLTFDEFARGYMENIADWVNDETEESSREVIKAHSRQGVRPGGSSKSRSIGKLKPGDISKMSTEEFEKHESEIDRQIAAELGA